MGDGVYACWAVVGGQRYRAAVNVGVAATFADADELVATITANIQWVRDNL